MESELPTYITTAHDYPPQAAYVWASQPEALESMLQGEKHHFFWSGRAPQLGDHITLNFYEVGGVAIDAVELRWGRRERHSQSDFLRNGTLQVGQCPPPPRAFPPKKQTLCFSRCTEYKD